MRIKKTIKKQLLYLKRHAEYILNSYRSKRRRKNISLHYTRKQPHVEEVIVQDFIADDTDIRYAERLLTAYHKSVKDYHKSENDVWSNISKYQAKFFGLLKKNNAKDLAGYLCNMNKEDATIGVSQGSYEFERIKLYRSYKKYVARYSLDKLVGLAEALGVLALENPEQGDFDKNIHTDPEILVRKISDFLGQDITPPNIDGGLLKLKIGNALINERDFSAIYTAYLIKDAKRICEIGGGVGRTCFWASKLGVSEYTILDLPHINVVQGYYLLKAMNGAVSLYGESGNQIRILPCHQLPEEMFDLVLNQDSFPEIAENIVVDYLKWIKDHAATFISINFESRAKYRGGNHLNVPELIQQVGDFKRVDRHPYWLRKGYTIERYHTPLSSKD